MSGRVLIFGGRGYMGEQFQASYPGAIAPRVDIADRGNVARLLDVYTPDVVVNCAGKTGRPNVDWCETHKDETLRANVTGALVVLEECQARSIYLVHLSSGCIYEGDNGGSGFTEEDLPNYLGSFYSRTKAWADQVMRDFPVLSLRLRMPFDGTQSERNLLTKIRRYSRVLDEPNSITHMPDFMDAARALIAQRATGVYNVVNPGTTSPYRLMTRYRELVNPSHRFERLEVGHLREVTRAGRSNCILNTAKLRELGLELPPVEQAVDMAMRELAREQRAAG